ncbi:hypothetical protein Metlim_0347 [Methanoplanus limicola DSM 2279]|uniref:Uncharacterized protein n=1 Tax=Methanoplanus limicola DSM 2279 TaxID=937775 RepID=H1Z112_9EURY|nr:hypothetical protein Metlim_0347 [Methanoplanus limicola DSM 2279]
MGEKNQFKECIIDRKYESKTVNRAVTQCLLVTKKSPIYSPIRGVLK